MEFWEINKYKYKTNNAMVKADTAYHPKERMKDADNTATIYFLCITYCISACAAQEHVTVQ